MRSLFSCCWFGMNYTWSKTPCWWTSRTSPGDEAHHEDLHHSRFIYYVTGRKSQVWSFSQNKHHIYNFRVFFFLWNWKCFQLTFRCKQTLCSFEKKRGWGYWKLMLLLTLTLNILSITRPSLLLHKFHSRHLLEQWFPIGAARHTCCVLRPGLEIPNGHRVLQKCAAAQHVSLKEFSL